MRKVMVSREEWSKTNSRMEYVELYEAWFHQFGVNSHEDGPEPIAIVERGDNGKVNIV